MTFCDYAKPSPAIQRKTGEKESSVAIVESCLAGLLKTWEDNTAKSRRSQHARVARNKSVTSWVLVQHVSGK